MSPEGGGHRPCQSSFQAKPRGGGVIYAGVVFVFLLVARFGLERRVRRYRVEVGHRCFFFFSFSCWFVVAASFFFLPLLGKRGRCVIVEDPDGATGIL